MNEKYIRSSPREKTKVASIRITEAQKAKIDALNFNLSAFVRDKLDEAFSEGVSELRNTDVIQNNTSILQGYRYAEIKQIMLLLFEIDKLLKRAEAHFGIELIYNLFTIIDFLEVNQADLSTLIEHDSEIDAVTKQLFGFLSDGQFAEEELASFFVPTPTQ